MILPSSTGPAGNWVLYDYGRRRTSSMAAVDGQAVATVAEVPQDELWLIDLVRVKTSDADLTSTAFICLDDPDYDVSGTATGSYDVADQNSPIQAPGGSLILVVWKNLSVGLKGNVYMQWTVLKSTNSVVG